MQDLEELEEAKKEFDDAVRNLSRLAEKGFKFKLEVGTDPHSDVLVTLADHEYSDT